MPLSMKPYLLSLFVLLSAPYAVLAQDSECHVSFEGLKYDLSQLRGEHFALRSRESPPTTMTDSLVFDLCNELGHKSDIASQDQCPSGTAACLTTTNTKDSESEPDRVVAVIPVGQTAHEPAYKILKSPKGLRISRTGASWPLQNSNSQTFVIDLLCEPDVENAPQFKSYDGETATVEWTHMAACPFRGDSPSQGDEDSPSKGSKSVGSGLGWFFLVLLLAFIAYFGVGAYYNYATYGATGFDLIPHRDFWREVPYMFQDVLSHLCSSIRPSSGRGRGGYIAV